MSKMRLQGYIDLTRRGNVEMSGTGRAFSIVLMLLLVVALLISLMLAVNVYRVLADQRSDAAEARLETSLLVNAVRMADAADAVSEDRGPEGRALVLSEHLDSGDYETRIYLYEGTILQEYAPQGSGYDAARATKIADSATFDFRIEGSRVHLSTDFGEVSVTLRSTDAIASAKGGE